MGVPAQIPVARWLHKVGAEGGQRDACMRWPHTLCCSGGRAGLVWLHLEDVGLSWGELGGMVALVLSSVLGNLCQVNVSWVKKWVSEGGSGLWKSGFGSQLKNSKKTSLVRVSVLMPLAHGVSRVLWKMVSLTHSTHPRPETASNTFLELFKMQMWSHHTHSINGFLSHWEKVQNPRTSCTVIHVLRFAFSSHLVSLCLHPVFKIPFLVLLLWEAICCPPVSQMLLSLLTFHKWFLFQACPPAFSPQLTSTYSPRINSSVPSWMQLSLIPF